LFAKEGKIIYIIKVLKDGILHHEGNFLFFFKNGAKKVPYTCREKE
jgi:hypothetical protein